MTNHRILHMDFAATPPTKSQATIIPSLKEKMENSAMNLEAIAQNRVKLKLYARTKELES